MSNLKKFGKKLPKQAWLNAAAHLQEAAPTIATILQHLNYEGRGQEDTETFLAEMQLACTALHYVAEFARDKCLIVAVPDSEAAP